MKKYIRIAVVIYITLFTCILWRWWLTVEKGDAKQEMVFGNEFRKGRGIRTALGTSVARTILNSTLFLHWNQQDNVTAVESTLRGEASCEGNFIGYDHKFAKLTNVVINPVHGKGRRGGENCSEVFMQSEKSEYFDLKFGYFKLRCMDTNKYTFNPKSHVSRWYEALNRTNEISELSVINEGWTIAVVRYEYANLYHTMTDFYNAFFVAKMFEMQPGNITVLWIDGHPLGALDKTWETLFGKVLRAGDIQKPEMFRHMVWGIMGYDSLINHHNNKEVPYLEEFRSFFLSRHDISPKSELNCSTLNIMFLWRRDYLAHPRNPSGSVSRKIKNENELIDSAKKTFRAHNVSGIQIDKFDMKEQLEIIARTDILIGMHGAGLSHTLFLPKHAGLIELYPTYWSNANKHFFAMARWRKLHYLTWSNTDKTKELPNHFTIVNVKVVTNMISKIKQKICG